MGIIAGKPAGVQIKRWLVVLVVAMVALDLIAAASLLTLQRSITRIHERYQPVLISAGEISTLVYQAQSSLYKYLGEYLPDTAEVAAQTAALEQTIAGALTQDAGTEWRADLEAPEGVVSPGTDARVVRVDLERRQNGATARLRVEERLEGVGRSRAIAAQWGPSPRLALRAAWFGGDPDGPEIWWYRRRAGSLYGWDRLTPGTWLGAWGRLGVRGVVLEASVDAAASGVDVALAVRAGG